MKFSNLRLGTALGVGLGVFAGAGLTGLVLAEPSFATHRASGDDAPRAAMATSIPANQDRSGALPKLADLVEKVSPSVVQIIVREASATPDLAGFDGLPPEFRWFFGHDLSQGWSKRPAPDQLASGSGFFIEGGYIVTNNHVVDHAKKLTVKLETGKEIEASLVGRDAKTDLAVIKVDAKFAPAPLKWGESEKSRVGDSIFTVGSPFALGNTVTAGIISGRGRDINAGPYDDFFQIDAPINPGNSGGPLMNAAGDVIGVNTAIYSPSGGNIGIGFSIPSDQARSVVRQLIAHGSVERSWLGVSVQPVTPDIAKSLGLPNANGALVAEVTAGSPAAAAGLKTEDVILSFGDHPIDKTHDLTRAVAETPPGATRSIKIMRGGKQETVSVRVAEPKQNGEIRKTSLKGMPGEAKANRASLEGLGLELGLDSDGTRIVDVAANSPAAEAGLEPGDRLLMINQSEVRTPSQAQSLLVEARKKEREAVLVEIEREGRKLFLGVPFA